MKVCLLTFAWSATLYITASCSSSWSTSFYFTILHSVSRSASFYCTTSHTILILILICLILLTTWHSILISLPLHSAVLWKRPSWQISVFKTSVWSSSLFLCFGPIIKQYFGKLGCHPFSPHDFYFIMSLFQVFTKLGFYSPTPLVT